MKKHTLKIAMSLLLVGSLFFANSANAQVEQGSILIDTYYGFPATGMAALTLYEQAGVTSSTSALGPIGLRFTYMFTEKIGIGLDGNYSTMKLNYNDGTYNYDISRDVIRVMLNTHYVIINEAQFQLYGNVGVGYRNAKWEFTSDDPNYAGETIEGLIPVAFKLGFGGRYMFTENIGAHAEISLGGGAWTNGGLSFAF